MNERAVVEQMIVMFKRHIADNVRLRDEGKPFVGKDRSVEAGKTCATNLALVRWNELIALQEEALRAAEARLAEVKNVNV